MTIAATTLVTMGVYRLTFSPGLQKTFSITTPKFGSLEYPFFEPLALFLISAMTGSVSPPTELRERMRKEGMEYNLLSNLKPKELLQ